MQHGSALAEPLVQQNTNLITITMGSRETKYTTTYGYLAFGHCPYHPYSPDGLHLHDSKQSQIDLVRALRLTGWTKAFGVS